MFTAFRRNSSSSDMTQFSFKERERARERKGNSLVFRRIAYLLPMCTLQITSLKKKKKPSLLWLEVSKFDGIFLPWLSGTAGVRARSKLIASE